MQVPNSHPYLVKPLLRLICLASHIINTTQGPSHSHFACLLIHPKQPIHATGIPDEALAYKVPVNLREAETYRQARQQAQSSAP